MISNLPVHILRKDIRVDRMEELVSLGEAFQQPLDAVGHVDRLGGRVDERSALGSTGITCHDVPLSFYQEVVSS